MAQKPKQARSAAIARKSSSKKRPAKSRRTIDDVAPVTKLAAMVAMLSLPKGATLCDLMTLTGWQEHSVRGALSGTIKKKLGYTLASKKAGAERVYRITAQR